MMTQQPGRRKWDSWEPNEFAALFSLTNEAGKWVRTTGWSAEQLGRGAQQTLVLHGCKCRKGVPGSRRWSLTTINQ